jgi:hypothetical protein
VRIRLDAGARSGTISYSGVSFACAGRLRMTGSARRAVTLRQVITAGRTSCADGRVTLRPAGATLSFSFRGRTGPVARGVLSRQ